MMLCSAPRTGPYGARDNVDEARYRTDISQCYEYAAAGCATTS